jgi:hypothetical protein
MNNALQALASNSVGPLAPATTFACQWWGDTTAARLKRRNSANTAWIDMGPLDSLSYLLTSGGTLTGPINDAPTQTIASATTTNIAGATSNVVAISGTTTITGLGTIAAGARRTVRFLGSLVLTYNPTSLILPTAANITTAANDSADCLSLGSGNWICLSYTLANGKSLAKDFAYDRSNILGTVSQSAGVPTGAIIEAGTNASGQFIKFADGTLICTRTVSLGAVSIGSAVGSWFNSATITGHGMPQTFTRVDYWSMQLFSSTALAQFGTSSGATTTTWPAYILLSPTSGTPTLTMTCFAIGRWF